MILAGDIGGTSARVALVEVSTPTPRVVVEERYPSSAFEGIDGLATAFLTTHPAPVEAACFGVAGPVTSRRVSLTNLSWVVDADALEGAIDAPASLINDLVAHAYGLSSIGAEGLVNLNRGDISPEGNRGLIAAGTGLGEAGLFWDGEGHRPFPSEGGHADFAPHDQETRALLEFLTHRGEPVSVEHVLSGPGIVATYEFLRETGRAAEALEVRAHVDHATDKAAAISEAAMRRAGDASERALRLFCSCYGAEAGNFALKILATGGVFIGGGIAPKIASFLTEATFMQAFAAKHRMGALMRRMPVWLVTSDRTALLGAARYATGVRSA